MQRHTFLDGLAQRICFDAVPLTSGLHEHLVRVAVVAQDHGQSCHALASNDAMLRYTHNFLEQATRTAVAYGRSRIEERLARGY